MGFMTPVDALASPLSLTLRLTPAEIRRLDAEAAAADAAAGALRLKAGVTSAEGVAVAGLDGYLFIGDGANLWERQYKGELSIPEIWFDDWTKVLARRQAEAAQRGVSLVNLVAPEKQVVLPGRRWTEPPDASRRPLAQLMARLQPQARVCYPAQPLAAAAAHAPVYARRDSHWTPSGGCAALAALLAALESPLDVEALSFAYRRMSAVPDLAAHFLEAPPPETVAVLAPAGEVLLDAPTFASTGHHNGTRLQIANPAAPDPRRVILFGDSFGYEAGFAAALSAVFREVAFVWTKSVIWDEVDRGRFDLVVWESAERFMSTTPAA